MKTTLGYLNRLQITFLLYLLIFNPSVNSQIVLDTVQHQQVGPGMFYTKYVVQTIPWSIDVLEADITNEYFAIETVKAFELLAGGREKTSSMSVRKNSSGHQVVGGVNGDFFNLTTGMPNNIQVQNGEVLRNERADWPTIGFNLNNEVSISNTFLTGVLVLQDTTITLNGINVPRSANQLNFYNHFFGSSTGTTEPGFEAVVHPVNGWFANDTIFCVVDSINAAGKNTPLTNGSMVVSASGEIANYLAANLFVSDTVKLMLNISPSISKLKEMMGGHPIIIQDGYSASMDPNDSFVYTRHPRTAVGINKDTTKLFLVTVDGRQLTSLGMNLFELADLMIQLGVYQGINLDGGGSTTMVIRNEVMNSPSDASGERSVSNALLVISKAPPDTLSYLNILPKSSKVFLGKQIQFSVSGTDKFYNPSFINPSLIKYQVSDSSMGTISSAGLFTAKTIPGDCYVLISYSNLTDSAKIVIKGLGSLVITPEALVTDNNRIAVFTAKIFDTENIEQAILAQSISWVCSDTSIGSVDIVGQFQGKKSGIAEIIASYLNKADTAIIKVEIGNGIVVIDSVESISDWELSSENADTSLTKISLVSFPNSQGAAVLKLEYSFTYQTSQFNWVYLNTDRKIYGVLDSIMLDVYSDGASHRIFFDAVDNENKQFRISSHKLANSVNGFETIKGRIASASNVIFPLTLKKVSIVLGSSQTAGQVYSGTVYFDNVRVKYPASTTSVNDKYILTNSFILNQNFPNPFNPVTKISWQSPVKSPQTLKVYDVLGREVATLVDEEKSEGKYEVEFEGNNLSSGIYFYRLAAGDFLSTKKMVLLR